ncbi:double-strand break repair protein MRE11-like isoform X2 [Augochlora pura]
MSSESECSETFNFEDTLKILVATDIHLGYNFDKKKGQESGDSFTTFEEILQYGKENEVDLILIAGDLFHDANPTHTVMLKCLELLRRYSLGSSKQLRIKLISDPEEVFRHCDNNIVNYEDPNFNVDMPIFSIHGKHDNAGFEGVGPIDLLSTTGFINYFGKYTDLSHIKIPPLIFEKGNTHVALFGLGYINDVKLLQLLKRSKVDFLHTREITDCFNLFVLHQSRASHLAHGHLSETDLPYFMDLVIWGHEHECRIMPEYISERKYYICQPGSSIATSLCEGESKAKHVGLLTINGKKFKMKKLKLKTVRPFVFDNLILDDKKIQNDDSLLLSESVYNYVDNYIESKMIPKAVAHLSGHPKQPLLPLIRLRIIHTKDEEVFDKLKLAQRYCEEVANPLKMVVFHKDRNPGKRSPSKLDGINDDLQNMADVFGYTEEEEEWNKTVQGELRRYFNSEENENLLTVLTVDGLNEALTQFINRNDSDAFSNMASNQMKKVVSHLETSKIAVERIKGEIKGFRKQIKEKVQEENIRTALFIDTSVTPANNDEVKDVYSIFKTKKSKSDTKVPHKRGRSREIIISEESD